MKRQDMAAVEGDFLPLGEFRRLLVPPLPAIQASKPDNVKVKAKQANKANPKGDTTAKPSKP